MISFIRARLVDISGDKVIVDTGSIGLEINIPYSSIEKLPEIESEILLYTYFKVAEDAMSLYGFISKRQLEIFKLLISVNGVGPKGALAILSILEVDDLVLAIIGEDEKIISKASGIGVKTAKRIIIELKDKIKIENIIEEDKNIKINNKNLQIIKETIEALTALGYSSSDAAKSVKALEITEDMNASKLLKLALKKL